jgi:hypothetical protein
MTEFEYDHLSFKDSNVSNRVHITEQWEGTQWGNIRLAGRGKLLRWGLHQLDQKDTFLLKRYLLPVYNIHATAPERSRKKTPWRRLFVGARAHAPQRVICCRTIND